ncbi:hypothetical protein Taro_025971 [Colocasia esculenta]|uniref:Trichome birefringence-like C-terminal domain-containing protein n=1 Tax=Colocasia esculenta TaxID=4460 RepID=A0A843VBN5_COLES|nr:hypothetical protein [Colocasia esculenta]
MKKEGLPMGSCDMAKKQQYFIQRAWGLRSRFNSLIAVLAGVVLVLVVSLTMNGGGGGPAVESESKDLGQGRPAPSETIKLSDQEGSCDLASGRWVYDNASYPLYSEKDCNFMSDQLACGKFGRKNLRFNATTMLERLRGKRMVFVGDSLNRGQWVSMVCLLDSSTPDAHKSMEANGSLVAFKVKEYNASIEFYWAPLLVESNSDDPVNHRLPERIIRAGAIEKHGRRWTGADILVFNSYLWWRRPKLKVLWGSFASGDGIYKDVEMLRSYELALEAWSEWLEFHVDPSRTQLFFMSMSPTHFWGNEWGIAGDQNCHNETEPITKEGHWGRGSDVRMMRMVEAAIEGLKSRGVSVQLLNITQLSEYRKDGHPSIHRKQWEPLTEAQLANPGSYADCIHWCLPGVPDVWNELLYAHMFPKTT